MLLIEALVVFVGLIVGSFLNVCIHRLPKRQSVIFPRSRCPQCGRPIPAWENIPLLSYLFLRGKCAGCGHPISWVYPTVEAVTALSFFLLYRKFQMTLPLAVNAFLFAMLIVLVFIDLFERILPDLITLGGAVAGLLLSPVQSGEFLTGDSLWDSLSGSLLGAFLGGGILWLVAAAYLKIKRIEGMGFGDIKMMVMVGAFLGWRYAWMTIFLGSLIGAVVGALFILMFRKGRRYELPFGSFLGLAAMVAVLWGGRLLDWYFKSA